MREISANHQYYSRQYLFKAQFTEGLKGALSYLTRISITFFEMTYDNSLTDLAAQVGRFLQAQHLLLATAESCTGGLIAQVITDVPGSSGWFERGFVTYSNASKVELLRVTTATLERLGTVSEACVREMAEGALRASRAQVSVAVSGIAGPEGGTLAKPVGTVWLAWARSSHPTRTAHFVFAGDRTGIRVQAAQAALEGILHDVN